VSEKHTQGLLAVDSVMCDGMHDITLVDPPKHAGNPVVIGSVDVDEYLPISSIEAEANARRLVAAWNFCDTFPTPALSSTTLAEVVGVLLDMVFAYVNKDTDIPHSFEIEALEKAVAIFEKLPSFFDPERTMSAESFTRTALDRLKSP
jgi:hypothetical protein